MKRTASPTFSKAFTLIELMITIAIVGILAAIAVPSYLTYTEKAKFSEVIMATTPFKTAVELCAQVTGALTACGNGSNGVPAAAGSNGKEVASVAVAANGTITATSNTGGTTYVLAPTLASGNVTWAVAAASTCLSAGYC